MNHRNSLVSLWNSNLPLSEKIIRLPLRLIPDNQVIKIRTGINRGLKWIVGSGVHKCWLGSYEAEKQRAISAAVREGMVIWDIGANVGFYTLAFARSTGHRGCVVAIEPLGENAAYLLEHITINKIRNVQLIQAALSDSDSLVSFSFGTSNYMGKIETEGLYKIPSTSADALIQTYGLPVPALIKIDVEGAEALVLAGASDLLTKHSPEIWLALHGEQAMRDCERILRDSGYEIYDLNGARLASINTGEVVAKKEVLRVS
jgi:FkbM family methyltransferase